MDQKVILEKGKSSEIPKDAIRITKQEALEHQLKIISEWKPAHDVWPYKYGIGALAGFTGLTSIFISNFYRRKLKLLHYGRFSMYFPTVVLPSFILPLSHLKFVTEEVLLQTSCPVCIQLRAVTCQMLLGVVYPMALAPVTGFLCATLFGTYRLPLMTTKKLPELFRIWHKMTLPLTTRLFIFSALHVGLAIAVTNFEAQSLFTVMKKLRDAEHSNKFS